MGSRGAQLTATEGGLARWASVYVWITTPAMTAQWHLLRSIMTLRRSWASQGLKGGLKKMKLTNKLLLITKGRDELSSMYLLIETTHTLREDAN